ncbi:MAG: tetratricopeptide repeat protein, partial [Anaerolineae bacterium]
MELTLSRQSDTQVAVACDGQHSHTFDLRQLAPDENVPGRPPQPLDDPVAYGRAVYQALFPPDTPTAQALAAGPERILLVAAPSAGSGQDPSTSSGQDPSTDSGQGLQTVPWEYAYGDDFVVLDCPFVRGLPADRRVAPPALDVGLHVVAVPSNPLDKDVAPLDIDGEWLRLQEIVQEVPQALTLERTRPPTLEQLRRLLANQRQRVLHFMGHGAQHQGSAVLLFENEHGGLAPVATRDLLRRVRGTVFLATLNACVSATPGPTEFGDLAAALVRRGTPYALGMRFSIVDHDARAFARVLYSELARGTDVERAVHQARLALEGSVHRWAVGVPVLYTALSAPAPGFAPRQGAPRVLEHQPKLEINALPRAEGAFQGRVEELKALGKHLTGDGRPRLLTVHGGGGQGKTALAREAVERFAHAWPGGVWAISLESLPTRELFVADLARFLGVPSGEIADPAEVERQTLARLGQQRVLLVLDNVETLLQGVEAGDEAALALARLAREKLPGPRTTLLATSRRHLGWAGEKTLSLGGLEPPDGARLFAQGAPQRMGDIQASQAEALSRRVGGHPLSLRLLGGAFNGSATPLAAFVEAYEEQLIQAEDRYKDQSHRHRTLYASIETSVRHLDDALRALLSGLWIFYAPFLPETAAAVFDPDNDQSPVPNLLHALWRRGLLMRDTRTLRDGTVLLYRLPPTLRPYAERNLPQAHEGEALRARFGAACAGLARYVYRELDRSAGAVYIAQQAREDLGRGVEHVGGEAQGRYLLHWGWILGRLGDTAQALHLSERALEIAQGRHRRLELEAMNNMALVYRATGQPQRALALYQEALPIMREVGDRAGEATTLNNMALVYRATGQPQRALALYQEALPIMREVGDRAGEATTLNNMAGVYRATG